MRELMRNMIQSRERGGGDDEVEGDHLFHS
jgi:hypothetical protein